jgi:phosphatidylserine/phosphatidylglycerophosphate/cardiolipin synthase-like enzyme
VYFNRGVAGSQSYSRRFGEYRRFYKVDPHETNPDRVRYQEFLRPEDVPDREADVWLSRGLEEAMLEFIGQARGPGYSIRAALYELTHRPAIQAFVDALESGSDVKVVHHAKETTTNVIRSNKESQVTVSYADGRPDLVLKGKEVAKVVVPDPVARAADIAVAGVGVRGEFRRQFAEMLIPRKITTISHNKFIILLKDGVPEQVWTGSTNVTGGGIYGQSNVGHIVRDPAVAGRYLEYWEKLATDPKKSAAKADPPGTAMRDWTVMNQPDLTDAPPPDSITPVFSPRKTGAMLDWYADRLGAAKNSVFFTAAFSVAEQIMDKVTIDHDVTDGEPYLRYLLLEGIGGLLKDKYPVMKKHPQNRIAWGETMRTRSRDDHDLIETLTGLNDHVNYLHTKYMLIDPLSDDPVVISGSANFSTASTVNNDENMLIIRGNTRVADIFLGEFMRLFNHFQIRNVVNKLSDAAEEESFPLVPDGSWTTAAFTEGTPEYDERRLFAGAGT